MSNSIVAASSSASSALPVKAPGQAPPARPVPATQQAAKTQALVAEAKQSLSEANSIVDQDKRNHSPGCVACDQKRVDKAQVQLAKAMASAVDQTAQAPTLPGNTVDFTA